MTRAALIACALLLAGCTAPTAGVSIETGGGGTSVSPYASGSIGGLRVGIRG